MSDKKVEFWLKKIQFHNYSGVFVLVWKLYLSPPPPSPKMIIFSWHVVFLLLLGHFSLNSSLFCTFLTVLFPIFSFSFPFFLFLSALFLFLLHFPFFSSPHIFPPKWHQLILPLGGMGYFSPYLDSCNKYLLLEKNLKGIVEYKYKSFYYVRYIK